MTILCTKHMDLKFPSTSLSLVDIVKPGLTKKQACQRQLGMPLIQVLILFLNFWQHHVLFTFWYTAKKHERLRE